MICYIHRNLSLKYGKMLMLRLLRLPNSISMSIKECNALTLSNLSSICRSYTSKLLPGDTTVVQVTYLRPAVVKVSNAGL